MAEAKESQSQRLLIMVARSESALDEIVTGLLDVGITGATVIESKGLGAILRQEMPMFAGLASFLPQHTGSRVVLSLTTPDHIERLNRFLGEMHPDDQPLSIVVQVEASWSKNQFPTD
ncbi:MAG: hypothetical protein ACF8PN_15975 [Phycisphaerales bacterium]